MYVCINKHTAMCSVLTALRNVHGNNSTTANEDLFKLVL